MASLKYLKLLQSVFEKLIHGCFNRPELDALSDSLVCVRSKLRALIPLGAIRDASLENALKRVANVDGISHRLQETLTALERLMAADAFPTLADGFDLLLKSAASTIDDLGIALGRLVPDEPLASFSKAQKYLATFPEFDPFRYRGHANDVFDAISGYWEECKMLPCGGQHKALLFLSANQTQELLFDLLFNREKPGLPPWGECIISGPKEEPEFSFKFVPDLDPGVGRCSRVLDDCLMLDFFTPIDKRPDVRVTLGREALVCKTRPEVENATLASLGDIFLQIDEPVTWSSEIKVIMALLFAYNTLAFSGTSWLPRGISKHGIYFLQDGRGLYLEPMFSSYKEIGGEDTTLYFEETKRHDDPRRFALGVVLTELWKEEGWETKLDDPPRPNQDSANVFSATRAMLRNATWNNHLSFASAINACVEPRNLPNTQRPSFDDESYQDFLKRRILEPLLEELLDIPDLSPKFLRSFLQDKMAPSVQTVSLPKGDLINLLYMKSTSKQWQTQRALALLKEFHETVNRFFVAESSNSTQDLLPVGNHSRVGIAILDTGLDINHASFQKLLPEMKFRNFMEQANCEKFSDRSTPESCRDSHGHGTFIAGIIKLICRISKIHVGKIAEEPRAARHPKDFAETVARAIKFACDEWQVAVINLSFGFPCWTEDLKPMRDALEYAKSVNVLVLAASHNFGNSWPSPWPAKAVDLVIPITSAGIDGKLSSSAKQPISGFPAIMALGEHITSDWASTRSRGRHFTDQVLGGASFATPMVVCMAALALYVVGAVKTEHPQSDIVKDLRTLDVMKYVLAKEFVENPESKDDLRYVKPMFLFSKDYSLVDVAETIRATVKKKKKRL
ncbi:hypothetical protein TOPH_08029 [Tolypocladium ophioglossoides CBS 100239]|uniref:Uncharacterized protein n=1 Tax=Tolypocladium ophioglossoides (strain CBS 100239) TaxID=1163406 RepID=A0A0L0MZH7_TOLOC|nr:hypothetical protein TOPH_08029 [Tolypocladium ophioglossoides CBS 100239]